MMAGGAHFNELRCHLVRFELYAVDLEAGALPSDEECKVLDEVKQLVVHRSAAGQEDSTEI